MGQAVPPFRRIAAELETAIRTGLYRSGAQLPSRTALAEQFKVSTGTAQSALELLRGRGLAASRPGAGWFVTLLDQPAAHSSISGGLDLDDPAVALLPAGPVVTSTRIDRSDDGAAERYVVTWLPVDAPPGAVEKRRDQITAAPAAFAEAEALGIPPGSPVLRLTRTGYTPDGRPLDVRRITFIAGQAITYEVPNQTG